MTEGHFGRGKVLEFKQKMLIFSPKGQNKQIRSDLEAKFRDLNHNNFCDFLND